MWVPTFGSFGDAPRGGIAGFYGNLRFFEEPLYGGNTDYFKAPGPISKDLCQKTKDKGQKEKPHLWGLTWQPCQEREFILTSKPSKRSPGAGQEAEGPAGKQESRQLAAQAVGFMLMADCHCGGIRECYLCHEVAMYNALTQGRVKGRILPGKAREILLVPSRGGGQQ